MGGNGSFSRTTVEDTTHGGSGGERVCVKSLSEVKEVMDSSRLSLPFGPAADQRRLVLDWFQRRRCDSPRGTCGLY